jgi:hypothetical protein
MRDRSLLDKKMALETWQQAEQYLKDKAINLVVLDLPLPVSKTIIPLFISASLMRASICAFLRCILSLYPLGTFLKL